MDNDSPFRPSGLCYAISGATTAPTAVQIGGPPRGEVSIMVGNSGTVWAFLGYGPSASVAATNATLPTGTGQQCLMLPPGSCQTFTMPPGQFYTAVTASSTASVYIQSGQGV